MTFPNPHDVFSAWNAGGEVLQWSAELVGVAELNARCTWISRSALIAMWSSSCRDGSLVGYRGMVVFSSTA